MIYIIMGKSSSGKDTVFNMLLKDSELGLKRIIPFTTRPIRNGEKDGREYHFVTKEQLHKFEKNGKLIEKRTYQTVHGEWIYATVHTDGLNPEDNSIMIGTLETYDKMIEYFGKEQLKPIYIEVDETVRRKRAIIREMQEDVPQYKEMYRRLNSDNKDFSPEKLKERGIENTYKNDDLYTCCENIAKAIISGRETGNTEVQYVRK